jgi:(1->4)-alpha-D-glucan 1-alpha-D-glucosylmutase
VYQGCELWDLSLVDPDNRRPVDYALRSRMLDELARRLEEGPAARAALAREVAQPDALRDGRAKLLLLREGLSLRRARPPLFLEASYQPLRADGPHADHVVAFARRRGHEALLCVAPRLVLGLLDAAEDGAPRWQGQLALPDGFPRTLIDVVTGQRYEGETLELAELFAGFPVALLASRAKGAP